MKSAFNAVSRLHSQAAFIKRPGTPDIFSPMRMTPSNYFRYIAGPSQTVVTGSEAIIPVATIYGQQQAVIVLDVIPSAGTWTLSFTLDGVVKTTTALNFDDLQGVIQAAINAITGCENVTVIGDLESSSTRIDFVGVKSVSNISIDISALVDTTAATYSYNAIAWPTPLIKRGDRIVSSVGTYTIKEVIEMPDLGGDIIGYRVRYE